MSQDPRSEQSEPSAFEAIRKVASHGGEYWTARDLMVELGYDKWQNFNESVIPRAMAACREAGVNVDDHFTGTSKMVEIGAGAIRNVEDYFVSRLGGYLLAMNGDPDKPQIAAAQIYFAIQTRRQEIVDATNALDEKRIESRKRLTESTKRLNAAAKSVGVTRYAIFADEGYKGLYGGRGKAEIERYKGIPKNEHLFDRIGHAELAANDFSATQAAERLNRENVTSEVNAFKIRKQVGAAVRQAIKDQGNTMPEDLPLELNIQPIIRKLDRQAKALQSPRKKPKKPDEID